MTASTSDPTGVVSVNGRPAPGGVRTIKGLDPGDEVAVMIDDAEGHTAYAYAYLPTEFPALERVTSASGVPAYPDSVVVELDERFREVGRYRARGLSHTDGHDSILLPDGSRYFMSYEPRRPGGPLDAVIQHEDAAGEVLWRWDSAEHEDETVMADGVTDYAHINSFEITDDDNLLVSFRNLSAVFKISRETGEVLWRLGGRASTFDFLAADGGPGDGGPCAQHTATELDNGNILVFDNGSWSAATNLCIDPDDEQGSPVERLPSRVAEWALDEQDRTATLVRDHTVNGRHAIFAGSAQGLPGGHSMVGWASERAAVASELDADGGVVWEVRDPAPDYDDRYFTYRAHATDVPDATPPVVTLGTTYVEGQTVRSPILGCTDRGGSSLQTCTATAVDTRTPGRRSVTAIAVDGAGNRTTVRRTYTVLPRYRPDLAVRGPAGRFVGGPLGLAARERGRPVVAVLRVRNDGRSPDRFALTASGPSRRWAVRLAAQTSPRLAPGATWTARLRIGARPATKVGARARVRVEASSRRRPGRADAVVVVARLRR